MLPAVAIASSGPASAATATAHAAASSAFAVPIATSGAAASTANVAASVPQVTADAIANSAATLVGAVIGAVLATLLAYVFQHWFAAKQERKQARLAAHRTMFALLQQINTVVLIQRDYVEAHLDNPVRYIAIPATPPFDTGKNILRLEDLAFMLDSTQGRAVLYDLYLAQENYIEAINQWNLRSSIHVQQLQPAMAALNIPPGTAVNVTDLENALGPLLAGTMKNHTTNCLISLRRAFEKLSAMNEHTRAYFVQTFMSDDFTKFDFPNTHGLTTRNPS